MTDKSKEAAAKHVAELSEERHLREVAERAAKRAEAIAAEHEQRTADQRDVNQHLTEQLARETDQRLAVQADRDALRKHIEKLEARIAGLNERVAAR